MYVTNGDAKERKYNDHISKTRATLDAAYAGKCASAFAYARPIHDSLEYKKHLKSDAFRVGLSTVGEEHAEVYGTSSLLCPCSSLISTSVKYSTMIGICIIAGSLAFERLLIRTQ